MESAALRYHPSTSEIWLGLAGTLKIDQAQYRELEAFSKFSSDMDPVTAMAIDRGRKNNQLLIQPQYSPMPVGEQIAILYCGTHSLLRDVPATFFMLLIWALPPTRDTEIPTLIAGRKPWLNKSVSRNI